MSPQETQALQDFLNQLTQVHGVGKDPQADAMIASAVAQQPDAAYLLVQRALLMEQALNTSKAQIASLQSQLQALQAGGAAAPSRGFLDNNAWGNTAAVASRPAYAPTAPAMAPAPVQAVAPQYQAAPPVTAPAPSSGFFGGGFGSTLGTVAATAAGVAGGAFLFQGIEHLMNGGSGSGLMHQNGLSAPVENVENTTVNNYYGADADKDRALSRDDTSSNNVAASDAFSDVNDIDFADNSDSGGYDDSMV